MRWPRWLRRGRALPGAARAGWWAYGAVRLARRQLRAGGLQALDVPTPPPPGPGGRRALRIVVGRPGVTCLERAVVRQTWLAAGGDVREVVLGVTDSDRLFGAHAWLDGDRVDPRLTELMRWPPAAGPDGERAAP